MRHLGPQPGWTVLVTGASSGLGKFVALELARRRCGLILCGRDAGRLKSVAQQSLGLGASLVKSFSFDLATTEGIAALLSSIEALGVPIDALVNNAGAGIAGLWSSSDAAEEKALLRLLVDAPLALTRGLLPNWRKRGKGALLNIGSTGAFQPGPHTAVYYAAKAFVVSWSLALAREERSWLTVTTFCPGAMKTGFSESAGKRNLKGAADPEKMARKAVTCWRKGSGLVVPGLLNKLLVFLSRLLPPAWTAIGVEAVQLSARKR